MTKQTPYMNVNPLPTVYVGDMVMIDQSHLPRVAEAWDF
jgi:hypothetical protein